MLSHLENINTPEIGSYRFKIGKCICCNRAFNIALMKDEKICLDCYKLNKIFLERRKELKETISFKKIIDSTFY